MNCIHLTASRFFGGPERQMLELARELHPAIQSTLISFREDSLCEPFLQKARDQDIPAHTLCHDTPHLVAAVRELKKHIVANRIDILVCHGYKANLVGLLSARCAGIPVVSVSRGWTGQCRRVRLYEALDRRVLRHMDQVVCVSHGQAQKVRDAGIAAHRITVIHNAIRAERFAGPPEPKFRTELQQLLPASPRHIIGAAGRLSPEKGFDILVEACRLLGDDGSLDFGLVLFGEGDLRDLLQTKINEAGLCDRVVLCGFTEVLDRYMPIFDAFVQSSYTEGLPNVLLEAAAAGTPVAATAVGGTSELVVNGQTGLLVAPGDPAALATVLHRLLTDPPTRHAITKAAGAHVATCFTFAKQAEQYRSLFAHLLSQKGFNVAGLTN